MRFPKKAKRGFTLVELVVVIAVIAILAAVSVGAYFGVTESANNSRLEQETKQMHTAIQTVALAGNANHTLNKDGLTVDSTRIFEDELEKQLGSDITVCKGGAPVITTPTIVLKEDALQRNNGGKTVYKTYEYYQVEISGKKIITDVVTGDAKIEKTNLNFDSSAELGEYVTIYFKNTFKNWGEEAYGYTYTTNAEGTETIADNAWPGQKATIVSAVDDIYSVEINTTFEKIIFNNGENSDPKQEMATINISELSVDDLRARPYWDGDSWEAQPVIETDYSTTGLTVYYSKGTWETVYCYAYNKAGESNNPEHADVNNGFPGIEMTPVEDRVDGLYKYTFTNDFYRVIFTNGVGAETESIPFTGLTETNNYWNGEEWTSAWPENVIQKTTDTIYFQNTLDWNYVNAYAWVNISENQSNENCSWPGQSMILVEGRETEKIYQVEIDKNLEKIKFSGYGIDQTDEIDIPETVTENNCYYNGNEWTSLPTDDQSSNLQSISKKDIYLHVNSAWTDPRAHYWLDNNKTAWPGQPMITIEENVYKISIADKFNYVVFNDGVNPEDTKTPDISLVNYNATYNHYHLDEQKWTDSEGNEQIIENPYINSTTWCVAGIINNVENWDYNSAVQTNDNDTNLVFEADLLKDDKFKFKK